jgi:hypothetical protein
MNGTTVMQWLDDDYWELRAQRIVAWVNSNGGEARYEPDWTRIEYPWARIFVRMKDGRERHIAPGWYIVMGDEVEAVRLNPNTARAYGYDPVAAREYAMVHDPKCGKGMPAKHDEKNRCLIRHREFKVMDAAPCSQEEISKHA